MQLKKMIITAFFTALLCISSYMVVPLGPVPHSLQPVFIFLTGLIIGPRQGAMSVLVWFALGVMGLPVFAGGNSGIATFFGPTGGFLIGFLLCVVLVGYLTYDKCLCFGRVMLVMLLGITVVYVVGIIGFKYNMYYVFNKDLNWSVCFNLVVLPFIPFDLLKALLATYTGIKINKALNYLKK